MACLLVGTKPLCWNIVDLTLRNKLQWNLNRNSYIFIQENAYKNFIWKMAAILSWPQCVKSCRCFSFENQVLVYFIFKCPMASCLVNMRSNLTISNIAMLRTHYFKSYLWVIQRKSFPAWGYEKKLWHAIYFLNAVLVGVSFNNQQRNDPDAPSARASANLLTFSLANQQPCQNTDRNWQGFSMRNWLVMPPQATMYENLWHAPICPCCLIMVWESLSISGWGGNGPGLVHHVWEPVTRSHLSMLCYQDLGVP